MYGNVKDYTYHFKYQVNAETVKAILPDLELDVTPSCFPDYVSEIYIFGYHNIDEVLDRLQEAGFDPVPETIAEGPWVYKPEEESYEEYRKRCGL